MDSSICFLSIKEAARLFRAKQLSPLELTRAFLDRIRSVDPALHSYLHVADQEALTAARKAEAEIMAGTDRGPLHGIPYALKDNIDTAGIPTTGNSRLMIDHVPDRDARVTAMLAKEAGAVLLGKTAMREFAKGVSHDDLPWPYPLNPWNPAHEFSSGSSTGSAAAVAAGLAMAALGTDTGGSIRNPASFCGLAGMKPTYGRVSRKGVIPNSFSLDHVGPLTWTVEDAALVLQAIAGFDPMDPGSARAAVPDFTTGLGKGLKGLRIGVVRHFYEGHLAAAAEVRQAFEAALGVMKDLGAEMADARLAPIEAYNACRIPISIAEFSAVFEDDIRDRRHLFGPKLGERTLGGAMISAADYIQAQRQRSHLARTMAEVLAGFDALVTLTTLSTVPLDDPARAAEPPNITWAFNIGGVPAMSVPIGFDGKGLPIGMQIVGKAFDEAMVFRVGHAYEKATPWKAKRPAMGGK